MRGTRIASATVAIALIFSSTAGIAAAAPPPPPPEGNAYNGVPIPVIAIWLAEIAVAVYIVTKNHKGRFLFPNSPA